MFGAHRSGRQHWRIAPRRRARTGPWVRRKVTQVVRSALRLPAQNASTFSTFPMFVPSLSWSNARICMHRWLKRGVLRTMPPVYSDRRSQSRIQSVLMTPRHLQPTSCARLIVLSGECVYRLIVLSGVGSSPPGTSFLKELAPTAVTQGEEAGHGAKIIGGGGTLQREESNAVSFCW